MVPATLVRFCSAAIWALAVALPLTAQITEDPELIGPGKVLFEFDGLRLGVDRDSAAGAKLNSLAVGSTLMSLGLTSRVDLQLGIDLYLRQSFSGPGSKTTNAGLGDVTVRTKWLAWDDQPTGQKLALIPYVILPSSTGGMGSHAVTGGLLVPWTRTKGDTTFGLMAEVDLLRNDADTGYEAEWQGTAYVSQEIFKPLSVYAEGVFSIPSSGLSRWEASGGVGVKFEVTKHVALDYEIVRGFNERATDWLHTLRFDWRW
jgi:hypothetical protein